MVEKITIETKRGRRTKPTAGAILIALMIIGAARLGAESTTFVRAPVWVYTESIPGRFSASPNDERKPPAQELDDVARFILSGMIYGWNFSYTPGDKTRNVEEYFAVDPIQSIKKDDPRFSILDVEAEYPKLSCWAQFTLDDATARRLAYWDSTLFRNAHGRGQGERNAETAGVRSAFNDALRMAVRDYMRKQEKNKPKEIRGEMIMKEPPTLAVSAGSFVADVKIIINVQEVIPYTTF